MLQYLFVYLEGYFIQRIFYLKFYFIDVQQREVFCQL